MAQYTCRRCEKPFSRRGTAKPKYCSRTCQHADRPPSSFIFADWYAKNREEQNAKRREWARSNPEKRKASRAKWRVKNREKLSKQAAVRSAARKAASNADMVAIIAVANGHCTYCGGQADSLEFDHIEPISRGGTGAAENLIPCCRACNASKSNKDAADWLFEKHGIEGLGRAIFMVEHRRFEPKLYPVEVRA